jgi:hypothetical protein
MSLILQLMLYREAIVNLRKVCNPSFDFFLEKCMSLESQIKMNGWSKIFAFRERKNLNASRFDCVLVVSQIKASSSLWDFVGIFSTE